MRNLIAIILSFFLLLLIPRLVFASSSALESQACAGVNGFLNQINIASVINNQGDKSLDIEVSYYNSFGELEGKTSKELLPREKFDFIVNNLGLKEDSLGTVCVETNANKSKLWFGGVTIYKPNLRAGSSKLFGDSFDFTLYYPFSNPLNGPIGLPLNTFNIAMPAENLVANWISIYDAIPGDSTGVSGELLVYNESGTLVKTYEVNIPDGGREDFSGHEAITSNGSSDAIGLAIFFPDNSNPEIKYQAHVTRYFYDCPGASCPSFLTAFAMPRTIPSALKRQGSVSTAKGEISIVELNNISTLYSSTAVKIFNQSGTKITDLHVGASQGGTTHLIITEGGGAGALKPNELGSAEFSIGFGEMALTSVFYKVSSRGLLSYAYATPLSDKEYSQQVSEFNSFIDHQNELELVNTNDKPKTVRVNITTPSGATIWNHDSILLQARETKRITLLLPENLYGILSIHSNEPGVFSRTIISRANQYSLAYNGISANDLGDFSANPIGTLIAKQIRIMPLGDSITEGQNRQATYRYWLYEWLRNYFNFEYVGSKFGVFRGQPLYTNFDQVHEGHSGWRTDQILQRISGWAIQSKPDIVLIHLGTNDMIQKRSVQDAIRNLELIIDSLRDQNPLVKIVIAKIIPNNRPSMPELLRLNQRIPEVVSRKNTPTSPVLLADQFSGYNSDKDNFDGTHPGTSGSIKMASIWVNKIYDLLMKEFN